MEPIIVEIRLAPDTAALLKNFVPSSPVVNQLPPQSPAEQAARMRMQPPPAPMPQQSAPTYTPQQYRPQPAPVAPYAAGGVPSAPIRNPQPTPVNPTQAAPMPNNLMMGAVNTAPVAGPAPSQPVPTAPSISHTTTQPTVSPSNAAPVAGAPTYETEQLARATATLADAGKMQQIQQLFQQFQIQQLTQLPKERYGDYATALRQLGVRI